MLDFDTETFRLNALKIMKEARTAPVTITPSETITVTIKPTTDN